MFVALNVGVIPDTPLLDISRNTIVTVEVATPFAMTVDVPVIVEFAATGAPTTALNVTGLPVFATGVTIESVFTPPSVDLIVQVAIPVKEVCEQAVKVLPVPVALNVGTTPRTGFMFASKRAIETVEASTPSAAWGVVPEMVEFAAVAAPAKKNAGPPDTVTGDVRRSVLISARVDLIVQTEAPEADEAVHAP